MRPWQEMAEHFTRIASRYGSLRTTDEAPIQFIRDALSGRTSVVAADIGCGEGRYDLLLFRFIPNLRLICVDINSDMLAELSQRLTEAGVSDFETRLSSVEDLDLGDGWLDAVFTFNAVHHFDFPVFLAMAGRATRAGGRIFVYTRTPEQNARTIWGRFFPEFCEREVRLFTLSQIRRWIDQVDGLALEETETFRFARRANLDRLLNQARSRHYSTFSLYDDAEFQSATRVFEERIRACFRDLENVVWRDENVMLVIGRTA